MITNGIRVHSEDSRAKVLARSGHYNTSVDAADTTVGHCHDIKSYYSARGVSSSMAWWVPQLIETQFYTIGDDCERFNSYCKTSFRVYSVVVVKTSIRYTRKYVTEHSSRWWL